MGLDMYLERKTYVKNWDHMTQDERTEITLKGKKTKGIKPERIKEITEEVGYWRKANHIHKWFVDNVQDGEDDCNPYYVSKEQLRELLNLCKKIDKDHSLAEELLPTQGGFFFGDTNYDDYYFQSIVDTITMLEKVVKESDDNGSFYYQSSW
jgi:hypothetical protein